MQGSHLQFRQSIFSRLPAGVESVRLPIKKHQVRAPRGRSNK
jgi:hypothetical protein